MNQIKKLSAVFLPKSLAHTTTLATSFATLASVLVLTTACGSGFNGASSGPGSGPATCVTSCGGSNAGDNNGSAAPSPAQSAAWNNLKIDGAIVGQRFDQTPVLGLDKVKKELIVRLPMLAGPLDGATIDIPVQQFPGIHIGLAPLSNGGSALVLRIPLKDVLHGVNAVPSSLLPNGDPLPAVAAGELPTFAVQLSNVRDINATIYLGKTEVAVYVNTPFDPWAAVQVPIRNAAHTQTWGEFSTIPAKSKTIQGGFFLSVKIPDSLARIIDDNL
jgi:hypothetical protein